MGTSILSSFGDVWRKLWQPVPDQVGLDALLSQADPRATFAARLRWLSRLCRWVASPRRLRAGDEADAPRFPQATRLRFVLNVLDRQPEWKTRFARTIRATVRDIDSLELYCESGMPLEPGLWTEALERTLLHLIPRNPYRADLGSVLSALFPDAEDADWVERLDPESLQQLRAVVAFEAADDETGWDSLHEDIPDALLCLVSEIRAIGLSTPIRKRLGPVSFRSLPFFDVTRAAEAAAAAHRAGDEAALADAAARFMEHLARCEETIAQVHAHLDEFGVSVKVVYLMDRLQAQIRRVQSLLELMATSAPLGLGAQFLARLIRDTHDRRRVSALIDQNLGLLAKKVVDRSAETGEHYIARDRKEYGEMLRAAAGGGAFTSITVWLKMAIAGLHLPPFAEGVLASLNYAGSFVAIQLAHFSLATKQPAMTGPALAARLHRVETEEGLEALTDEVVHLVRSQAAAVAGNLALVVPCVLLVALLSVGLFGTAPLGEEKARHVVESLSLFGPTLFFAAFTGGLLWLSSLASGWADNWFVLRQVGDGITHNPRIVFVLGRRNAEDTARFLHDNIGGFAGNISLGLLLGLVPELLGFFGLPIEVRHVTLASGQLAAAGATLGFGLLREADFWLAVAGLLCIGLLNVGVSFALALALAVRARQVEAPQRSAIRQALWRRLIARPLSFFYPTAESLAAKA